MKTLFLKTLLFYNTDILEKAKISGMIGGVISGRYILALKITDVSNAALITIVTTTISFFLPLFFKWVIKKTKVSKANFRTSNVSKHKKSTYIGLAVLAVLLGLVLAGKAEFTDVAGLAALIIPFLLWGKKTEDAAQ